MAPTMPNLTKSTLYKSEAKHSIRSGAQSSTMPAAGSSALCSPITFSAFESVDLIRVAFFVKDSKR